MTDARQGLTERVASDGSAVERAGWRWAAQLREGDQPELADAVDNALAADGAWGLVDLTLAGPALGGLDEAHVAEVLAFIK